MSANAKMVFLKPSNNWKEADAIFYVWYWTGSGEGTAGKLQDVGLGGLYAYNIGDHTNFKFTRNKPSSNSPWTDNWGETGNLTYDASKPCYNVVNWNENGSGLIAAPSAYIAGASELTGHTWSANASENKMTLQNNYTWTLTKTIASINQGDYQFKATDGSWNWSLGDPNASNKDKNAELKIQTDGKYNVTFTYNPSANTVSAVATPIYFVTVNSGEGGTASGTGECVSGNSINISAEALENYEFLNWTIASGEGSFGNASEASTTFQPTSNATIQANFRSTVTYSLTLQGGTGIASVTGNNDNVTLDQSYNINAEIVDGYSFAGWTADVAANAEITDASLASTSVVVKNGSVVLTASATEITSTLTTANTYSEGTPDIAAPTASATEIGVATTATVTATPATGYNLASWTLENCVRTDGGAENATTITIKSNGDGAAAIVTANYEINKYYIIGSFNSWGKSDANYEMTYDNGVYKKEVTFEKDAEFKINDGADAWWGYDNLKGVTYKELAKPDDSDNIKVTAEGSITFTIVFNLSKHLITFEGLTNKYSYVLMGVDGDWDTGIELALNPDATNEYVLKNQIIRSATDAVKVVTLDEGSKIAENNTVKDGSVPHTLTDENIVLADGVYNFWFNVWDGIYIEESTATPISLTGLSKTLYGQSGWGKKYTQLTDGSNIVSIYNGNASYAYGDYLVDLYLESEDITVSGFGTWQVVDGVETLTAKLVDENKTIVYKLTATVSAVQTFNLTCNNATYTITDPSLNEVTITGVADGKDFTITIAPDGAGYYSEGEWDGTPILATSVTFNTLNPEAYSLVGTYVDAASNTYNVNIVASPLTMEAKDDVTISCDADGVWSIEAYADDFSWGLTLDLEFDEMTGNYIATGSYVADLAVGTMEDVAGTGQLYFDETTGRQVFEATTLTTAGGQEISPVLYASTLDLMTNDIMTGMSWFGANYYNIALSDKNYQWDLDLHLSDCTGEAGTYNVEVVDPAEMFSTYSSSAIVTGTLTINDDKSYEGTLYTKDSQDNQAMEITVLAWKLPAQEYVININDATVIEDLSQYGSSWSMKGEAEVGGTTYPVTVEIQDDVDVTLPSAEVYVTITAEDLGFVDGDAILTIGGGKMAVSGTLENEFAGVKFVFDISGDLPACANIRLQTGNNAGILAAADGKQVNVTVARNFTANDGYYTLCVPFDMPASVIGKAYQISEILGNSATELTVNFVEVTNLVAGQPYLIEPATDLNGFTVENVTIDNSTPAAVTVSGAGVTVTMQGKYSRDAKTNGLYWIGNGGYLYNDDVWTTGLCAYFDITTPSGIAPRMRVATSENAETGLDNITNGENVVKTIVNGQLVITIDGVQYNAMGVKL